MAYRSQQWLLQSRPTGAVREDNFSLHEVSVDPEGLETGEVVVKTLCLGFEPAMRGWLDDVRSYLPPVQIGEVMRAPAVCRVVASRNPELPEGALLMGFHGWQEYARLSASEAATFNRLPEGTPPTMALSIMGGTSLTAWFGLIEVGKVKAGETVLVSGAAGATGSVVCQLALARGCRVIGIAGGEEKLAWLREECGVSEVIDYKIQPLAETLTQLCPDGIDLFFDNVGAGTLEAGIDNMRDHGRIVLCGAIADYNTENPQGPGNMFQVIARRLQINGFIMLDYIERSQEAIDDLLTLLGEGKLAWREDVQHGFENIPATLLRLFSGENRGKQLLSLED